MAQVKDPVNGDWILQVYKDIEDFELPMNFSFYEQTSKDTLNEKLKEKSRKYAFKKYQRMKTHHSKLKQLRYTELKMQPYLLNKQLSIEQKKVLLQWRVHMEKNFGENFRGGKNQYCVLCVRSIMILKSWALRNVKKLRKALK